MAGTPNVVEQAPTAINPIVGFADRALQAGAVALAGLSFAAVGTALKGFIDTSSTEAQTTGNILGSSDLATTSRSQQVEEYVNLTTENSTGAKLSGLNHTRFVFLEQCKDGSKQVNRQVTVTKTIQALGLCNVGSKVTASPEKPLSGSWKAKPAKMVLKATRHNNHSFKFVEQEENTPTTPVSTTSTTPAPPTTAQTPPPSTTTTPPPVTTTPPPPPPPPPVTPSSQNPFPAGENGPDDSWAQCTGPNNSNDTLTGSVSNFNFGIVDLQDGLGYSANPCLASEANDFTLKGIPVTYYINSGLNVNSTHLRNPNTPYNCGPTDLVCTYKEYGYNNALQAVAAANNAGINVASGDSTVAVDVEQNNTWDTTDGTTNDNIYNQASLEGDFAGLQASGVKNVILYSNTSGYNQFFGSSYQPGWNMWLPTGENTTAGAVQFCNTIGPDGGNVELVQSSGQTTTGTTGIPIDVDTGCIKSAS